MTTTATIEARELRRQIRDWRVGRANTKLLEALSEAYIVLFATVMLGAMAFNVVRQIRIEAADACSAVTCADARGVLPLVFAVGAVAMVLLVARLFGPLVASPAEGSWLLASPVDRGALMRSRLIASGLLALAAGALLGTVDATVAGSSVAGIVAFAALVAGTALTTTMFAAIDQISERQNARYLTWGIGAILLTVLTLVAAGAVPGAMPTSLSPGPALIGLAAVALAVGLVLAWRASRDLSEISKDRLTSGGALLSNLSGALTGLDPGLMYDLLLARRWQRTSVVRAVRGGPSGAWALVWKDVLRLRRSPHTVVFLAAALVVPYVAATLGLGKAVAAIAALTGFLAGIGLCSGLRVLTRTPGLLRCLPMSSAVVRLAGITAPGALLIVWGIATAPAIQRSIDPQDWPAALATGVAVGFAALAAVTRWIVAPAPDFSGPLVSSPAGAVPPSIFGAAFRGLDILLLLTAPILLAPPILGAQISIGLAVIVLAILLSWRKPEV